jgi:hypothetical protein
MKRLLFPAFVLGTAMLSFAACDPDLGVVTTPGEGGVAEGGSDAPVVVPPVEGGTPSEGGTPVEGGVEAGIEHAIDGVNDFAAGEKFASSSPGYDGYVSWDDKKVYFGMSGADLGTSSASKWVLVYVDGNPGNSGTAVGITYACDGACAPQQANLPFNAGYHLRWKLDAQYSNLQKWSGTAWTNVGPISTFERKGTFWEISLARLALGSPTKLKVHMTMLIEQAGAEWTYAGIPSTSFTDGKAPANFTKYYEFDLADLAKAPNTYPVK